jgi:hypothetical protein
MVIVLTNLKRSHILFSVATGRVRASLALVASVNRNSALAGITRS